MPSVGLKKESGEANHYVSSRPGLRRTSEERGYRGRLDKWCGGGDLETCASEHGNHHQGCQRHNDRHDWSSGEEKQLKHWTSLSVALLERALNAVQQEYLMMLSTN